MRRVARRLVCAAAADLYREARRLVLDNPTARGVILLAATYPVAALLAPKEARS